MNRNAQTLYNKFNSINPVINHIYVIEMGCALGVHAGPGSLAVGIQEINDDI